MVTTRSPAGIALAMALSAVVLPAAVPPEITRFSPASTALVNNSASAGVRVPSRTKSSIEWAISRCRRIVTQVNGASGGQITCSREPSGSRASAAGLASSSRRPAAATVLAANARSSCSLANAPGICCFRPPARTTNARSAGLPRLTLDGLRHSYATAGLAAGVDVKVMSERLGHASTGLTADLYQHVLPAMDAAAAARVAGLILGAGQ